MVKLRLFLFGILAAGLAGNTPARGAEAELTYKIACPPTWPGPGKPLPLSYNSVWVDWSMVANGDIPWIDDLSDTKPGSVQMDCAYGPEKYRSWRRVTLKVPGSVRKCTSEKIPGSWRHKVPFTCETRPEPDRALGEVAWQVAAPVSVELRLFGIGLDMTAGQIRDFAARDGYDLDEEAGRLVLVRPGRRFEIAFWGDTERPREIVLVSDDYDDAGSAVYAFGFDFRHRVLHQASPNSFFFKLQWFSPDQMTVLEYWPPIHKDERPSLHLIDRR
ncbi:hypothetical protein [Magnetospirillum sp. UT-4]|uniref:hypothetical protein n=1 Tax=Magnetospirillum sp. UT-4 TaxID=2681467 RepID=UPI00137ECDE0|nr:hypothetical protein [Magnetospirillum sp. UT-4]CAA7622641.1 exported hypothetical protein [Magnetospirillum sp. UT-4]